MPSDGPPAAENSRGNGAGAPIVTRCDTRSGWSTAVVTEVMPPIDAPISTGEVPSVATTARRSATRESTE